MRKKGDSQHVAMTAHFQVRTFEVRTLFQVVYSQGMTPIAKIVIAISIKFEIAIAISKKIADRDRDQFTYC